MSASRIAEPLRQLVATTAYWDRAAVALEARDPAGLIPAAIRRQMRHELDRLCEEYGAVKPLPVTRRSGFVQKLRGLFLVSDLAALRMACERRERLLMRCYEQICNLDLPLAAADVLLRQHRELKRAAHRRRVTRLGLGRDRPRSLRPPVNAATRGPDRHTVTNCLDAAEAARSQPRA